MSFDELMQCFHCREIRNCPGRYVIVDIDKNLTLIQLLGADIEIREFRSQQARDPVWVVQLNQGGIISYQRADGSFLHTLNTPEGFQRKLSQLQIEW